MTNYICRGTHSQRGRGKKPDLALLLCCRLCPANARERNKMANRAASSKLNIRYKLNGRADVIEDWEVSKTVAQLRDAIKEKWGDDLQCTAPRLDIYEPGTSFPVPKDGTECIDPFRKIADLGLSESDILIVVAPLSSNNAPNKKRRLLASTAIENKALLSPADVMIPTASHPKFVCPELWFDEVQAEIVWGLENSDDEKVKTDRNNIELDRIPPMGLVRCSRGGKTRALCEIANKMKGYRLERCDSDVKPVACIYVSFNDFTGLEQWEQRNPLQALLRRIAFAALSPDDSRTRSDRFVDFLMKEPVWEESAFLKWIGDTPCVLLIDELNNLNKLTEKNSTDAEGFGLFLKREFISKKNRYLVFSSHLLGTFSFLSEYLDRSKGSCRPITLQELPIVPSFQEALTLKKSLNSVREAMYYGLIPGMIYESNTKGKHIGGKRSDRVKEAIRNHSDELDACFRSILKSLIDGYTDEKFPEELGLLLDSVQPKIGDLCKIRWVPYHLQFVLHCFGGASFAHSRLAEQLSEYCNLVKDAKELSGEGWESLFVLFLVARCLNGKSDKTIVPNLWFETGNEEVAVVLNNYDATLNENLQFADCKTWDEMKRGVVPVNESRCLNILYPSHNNFEVYDVIVVYFFRGKKQFWGYQLKERKAPRKHKAHRDMVRSLFVQGSPPVETKTDDEKGWTIPGKEAIDTFFGESGKHWTPENWRRFRNSAIISTA